MTEIHRMRNDAQTTKTQMMKALTDLEGNIGTGQ